MKFPLLRANLGKPRGAEPRSYVKQKSLQEKKRGARFTGQVLFYMLVEPPKNLYYWDFLWRLFCSV